MTEAQRPTRNAAGVLIGGVIMLIGVALFLDRTGILLIGVPYGAFWGVLVITIGLIRLSQVRADGRREGGWWLLFGAWMLLNEMHVWRFQESWPLLIVAIGINLVWKEIAGSRSRPARVE